MVVVFGSYAKGTQRKDSDVDVLVLSPFNADLSDVQRFYGIKASIKEFTDEEFKEALMGKDFLIEEVIKNHILLVGSDLFVMMVLEAVHE